MDAKQHYSGLTDTQVKESREKFGSNLLTPPQKTPLWKLFSKNFKIRLSVFYSSQHYYHYVFRSFITNMLKQSEYFVLYF